MSPPKDPLKDRQNVITLTNVNFIINHYTYIPHLRPQNLHFSFSFFKMRKEYQITAGATFHKHFLRKTFTSFTSIFFHP